jgi:hypothetical protein
MVRGLSNSHAGQILGARSERPFASIEDVWRRSGVPLAELEKLADADAFRSLGVDRRQALWQVRGLGEVPLPLFAFADAREREPEVALKPLTEGREVVEDYRAIQLSLRAHPLAFLRPELDRRGVTRCGDLKDIRDGKSVTVAGVVLIRQRPGSAKGVLFITIEDETGVANAILWPDRFEAQRRIVLSASMIGIKGVVQKEGDIIHVVTARMEDMTPLLHSVGGLDFPHRTGPADGHKGGAPRPARQKAERQHPPDAAGVPPPRRRPSGAGAGTFIDIAPSRDGAGSLGPATVIARSSDEAIHEPRRLHRIASLRSHDGQARPLRTSAGARRATCSAGSGDTQPRHAGTVDRPLPAGEFLERETVAVAGLVHGEQPPVHRGDDFRLAAHHPAGGARRRQRVERERLAERADHLCRPYFLVFDHSYLKTRWHGVSCLPPESTPAPLKED